jgi:hypothetical protein
MATDDQERDPPVASTAATTARPVPVTSPDCRSNEKGCPLERGTPAGAVRWHDEAAVELCSDVRIDQDVERLHRS